MLCGFGLGLRWIGVEPWLYHIAPAEARGRLVGFHETLIALAPIVAPALASFCGLQGHAIFWIGAAFVLAALLPLGWARQGTPVKPTASPVAPATDWFHGPWGEMVFRQGLVIALLGGMLEAAVSGLFSLFAQGRGMDVARTTDLLAIFGLGGLLLQYGMGWLADHRGLGMAAKVCALGIVLAAVGLAVDLPDWLMVVAVFLLGGMITALLTLALIASTLVVSGNLERNVSLISMLYTVSAIAGPLLAGASMQASHSDALMGFTVLAALVMLGFLGLGSRSLRRTVLVMQR
jgi:MFS family permease